MLRAILGAACGFVLGGMFGVGLAILIVLGEAENGMSPDFPVMLLLSLFGLIGAGIGAVTGAIVGATGAIVWALKLLRNEPPPPPAG
jgi:hypothetical protein